MNYANNATRAQEALSGLSKGYVVIQAKISKRGECINLVKAHEKLDGLDLIVAIVGWSRPTAFNDIGIIWFIISDYRRFHRRRLGYCIYI
jgi:hypothetical protein